MRETRITEMNMRIYTSCNYMFSAEIPLLCLRMLAQQFEYEEIIVLLVLPEHSGNAVAVYQNRTFSLLIRGHDNSILKKYHFCFGLMFLNLSFITPQKASPNIPLLILDVPSVLSTKMIGTSFILKPNLYVEYFISIWKP